MLVDVQALAREHTAEAIRGLVELDENPQTPAAARVHAWNAVLDRAWVKPRAEVLLETRSEEAERKNLQVQVLDIIAESAAAIERVREIARRLPCGDAFVLPSRSLPIPRGAVAFIIGLPFTHKRAALRSAIPARSRRVIDMRRDVQPYDRVVWAMLLGLAGDELLLDVTALRVDIHGLTGGDQRVGIDAIFDAVEYSTVELIDIDVLELLRVELEGTNDASPVGEHVLGLHRLGHALAEAFGDRIGAILGIGHFTRPLARRIARLNWRNLKLGLVTSTGIGARGRTMSNTRQSDRILANPSAKSCLSTVGPGLVVFGNVSSAAEIHVYGRISGDVHCSRLIIGLGGRIEGNVSAQHVEVQGELAGGASARIVRVGSTGQVDGDVQVENFTIEPGGRFDGLCRRTDFRGQIIADQTSIDREAAQTEGAEEAELASEAVVLAGTTSKQTSRLAGGRPLQMVPVD